MNDAELSDELARFGLASFVSAPVTFSQPTSELNLATLPTNVVHQARGGMMWFHVGGYVFRSAQGSYHVCTKEQCSAMVRRHTDGRYICGISGWQVGVESAQQQASHSNHGRRDTAGSITEGLICLGQQRRNSSMDCGVVHPD